MRTKVFIFAIVGVLAFVGYLAYRSFNIQIGELAGENKLLKTEAVKAKTDYDTYRKGDEARDVEREKIIAASNAKIDSLSGIVVSKNKEIAALKTEQTAIKDCPALVINLKAQVAAYEINTGNLAGIIFEQKTIIAARNTQIANLKTTITKGDATYNKENALRLNVEAINGKLKTDLGWTRFWSNSKTVVIIGEAIAIGYLIFNAKK